MNVDVIGALANLLLIIIIQENDALVVLLNIFFHELVSFILHKVTLPESSQHAFVKSNNT